MELVEVSVEVVGNQYTDSQRSPDAEELEQNLLIPSKQEVRIS